MLPREGWLRLVLSGLLLGGGLGLLHAGNALASDDGGDDPMNVPLLLKEGKSLNWGGYAVQAGVGAVTEVKAQWKVPSVDCGGIAGNHYSSAWIGIDGYKGVTVEQTGTRSDCLNGTPTYRAFYEMFPAPPVIIPLAVAAGDSVSAAVSYAGLGTFELSMTNHRTGSSYKTSQVFPTAARQSAEVVVERSIANESGLLLPLADFGTVKFSNTSVTINGKTETLADKGSASEAVFLSNLGGVALALPSALGNNGGFSVAWKQSR